MAVTGVNNYSNIYTNAYTGNIRKNNAKETTEKQVVEQTEDVKTGITRKLQRMNFPIFLKNLTVMRCGYGISVKSRGGKSSTIC